MAQWDSEFVQGKTNHRQVMDFLEKLAGPERLIRIAFGRSSPCGLRGCAASSSIAGAIDRTGGLFFIWMQQTGSPMGTLFCLARPERFELPTTWFEVMCSKSHKHLFRLPKIISGRPINLIERRRIAVYLCAWTSAYWTLSRTDSLSRIAARY